jgi:Protein of unknown function (DUF4238)
MLHPPISMLGHSQTMDIHEFQKQHRVPQIYLKQFGFEEGKDWFVTVLDLTKDQTENILISNFTTTVNEFDYWYFNDIKARRHFEITAGNIEGRYAEVLNSIKHQRKLIPKHEDILRHFISSLICRSQYHRGFFSDVLETEYTRSKFLTEVTMFDEKELPDLKIAMELLKPKERLLIVTGILANHIVKVLRTFKAVVLRDFAGRGWFTTDNPVYIDYQENYRWIIPVEAELYLPLSREYCLFLFHDKSPSNGNTCRSLAYNRIHKLDEVTHNRITRGLVTNSYRYLIVPPDFKFSMETYDPRTT